MEGRRGCSYLMKGCPDLSSFWKIDEAHRLQLGHLKRCCCSSRPSSSAASTSSTSSQCAFGPLLIEVAGAEERAGVGGHRVSAQPGVF